MKKLLILLFSAALLVTSLHAAAKTHKRYGEQLCAHKDYFCIKVRSGESWESLFPNAEERDIVRRVNRMNTRIWAGMVIAIPRNLSSLTIYDVSPFPRYIEPPGEKTIYVSQKQLAWGAYDSDGELMWWGPISPGKGYCADSPGGRCNTPSGSFRMIRKQGPECISTAFPRRRSGNHGGAPMPYCMHFYRGFALHGSPIVPGRPDSHGCVRLFTEDAKWLNHEFIELPGSGKKGTRVIIEGMT